ncbi:MAG TPA: CAP domain-containing protein [Candidatus Paceibacterota bacterium]
MIDFVKRGLGFLRHYFVPHEHNSYKPHFFHKKSIAVVSLFAVAVFSLSLSYPLIISRIDYLASVLPAVLIDLANEDRSLYSLTPLTRNPVLEAAAQEKANDMARYSYFAHVSPTGITPWYWFTKNGYRFIYAGENLAVNFNDSGVVNQAWMNSPGHRANILNQQFSEIGIATAEGIYQGQPTIFVAQYFGRPVSHAPSLPSIVPSVARVEASEVEPLPTQAPAPVNEPEVESISETPTFVAVRNIEETEDVTSNEELVTSNGEQDSTKYASLGARVLSSPNTLLHLIYYVLIAIVLLAIVLSLAVELKRHHGRHLASGLALLVLIVALTYVYQHISATPVIL